MTKALMATYKLWCSQGAATPAIIMWNRTQIKVSLEQTDSCNLDHSKPRLLLWWKTIIYQARITKEWSNSSITIKTVLWMKGLHCRNLTRTKTNIWLVDLWSIVASLMIILTRIPYNGTRTCLLVQGIDSSGSSQPSAQVATTILTKEKFISKWIISRPRIPAEEEVNNKWEKQTHNSECNITTFRSPTESLGRSNQSMSTITQ